MVTSRENVGVRKCPKCGSVWYTALPKCAFCGVEGEEIQGPVPPSKLNLGHGGVTTLPNPKDSSPKQGEPAEAVSPAPLPKSPALKPTPEATDPAAEKLDTLPSAPAPAESGSESPLRSETTDPPLPAPAKKLTHARSLDGPAGAKAELRVEAGQEERGGLAPAAPQIPSATVPIVFGVLGVLACVGLPLLGELRHDRVLGVLALLGWAVTAPFGPFAWFTGQRYADRCHALGFRPSSLASTGKFLGMVTSFVLTLEFSALAIFIAVQILSGRGPEPVWK
jgi:hypothetical protein